MNSVNQFYFRFGFVAAVAFVLTSCASYRSTGTSNRVSGDTKILAEQPGEVSLREDRSNLDQARKDIPEEIKKQNDEIAMLLSFVVRDSEEDPGRLRERFNTALRKKRDAVDKKVRRAREDFSKKEKDEREAFLKKSKTERDRYLSSGRMHSAEDRKRFFDDQEDARKSFFADQQEKRKDFESRITDERKDSEDFIREKQNAFNQELRAYQARYVERKHQAELKKEMEAKSRNLERVGKPVQPVTSPRPTDGAVTGSENGAAASGATLKSSSLPRSPYDTTAPASGAAPDPLADFDKIPPGPATPLTPGTGP
jgi:ElaB/YqjD/DUF883 family membrane-anchored ribosome-binding protein